VLLSKSKLPDFLRGDIHVPRLHDRLEVRADTSSGIRDQARHNGAEPVVVPAVSNSVGTKSNPGGVLGGG